MTFFRLAVGLPLNVPVVYSTLIEYELVPEDDWSFIFMSHHIADLWLPQDSQYCGVVEEADRQLPLALNFALFEIHRATPYGRFQNLPEHRAVMGMEDTSWFGIIHLMDLLDVCIGNQECIVQLEGRFILPAHSDVYLFQGATVRIWIGCHFDPETNSPGTGSDSDESAEDQRSSTATSMMLDPQSARLGHSSRSSQPFAPLSGGFQMLCCLLLPWAAGRLTRSWQQCRTHARLQFRRHRRRSGLRLRSCRRSRSRRWKNGMCLSLLLCHRLLLVAHVGSPPSETTRYGEALHPGPSCFLGITNPGGIRGKEMIYGQLPSGIWGIAETHLAAPGILRPININWPRNEYAEGRAQLVECWLGPFSLTGATIYGWPSGPTYSQSGSGHEQLIGDGDQRAGHLPNWTQIHSG